MIKKEKDWLITAARKFNTNRNTSNIRTIAQSAGAIEYTDCLSTEGLYPLNKCPNYDTK